MGIINHYTTAQLIHMENTQPKWNKMMYEILFWGICTSGIILSMGSTNKRWRYIVTLPLHGWVHTQSDPYKYNISNKTCTWYVQSFVMIHLLLIALQNEKIWPVLAHIMIFCDKKSLSLHYFYCSCPCYPGALLLTWFNFNPSMDK